MRRRKKALALWGAPFEPKVHSLIIKRPPDKDGTGGCLTQKIAQGALERKKRTDPVDLCQGEVLVRRGVDGHGDQGYIGVRRLLLGAAFFPANNFENNRSSRRR